MQTLKLYDLDSRLSEFEATVLSCERSQNAYKTELDRTAFFPEAGGQPCDTGTIAGISVNDVREEDGVIYHYTEEPIAPGLKVKAKIDYNRRFSFMQNHSGEHIVSGIVHKKYGFDNVSFHLNEQFATLDFNGILTRGQLDIVEREANEAVYNNLPVRAYYPSEEELKNLNFRSKKEINGKVRIVDISGVDVCACCAPHVNFTGEIGIIKLLDTCKMRGGTRIVLKCGRYALADYQDKFYNVQKISDLLSSKQNEAALAVENLIKNQDYIKHELNNNTSKLIKAIISATRPDISYIYQEDLSVKELQMLADGLHKAYNKTVATFSGKEVTKSFVLCGEEAELTSLFDSLKSSFAIKGGGRGGMIQGSITAELTGIEEFFKKGQ